MGAQTRGRVVIEGVKPEVDGGRFPIKRTVGEAVVVEASVYADGHDVIACCLLYRREEQPDWNELPMKALGNDRWRAEFSVNELGRYLYTIQGWVDPFQTWRRDLMKRIDAGQDVGVDLLIGAELIEKAARRAPRSDATRLRHRARALKNKADAREKQSLALDEELAQLVLRYPDRKHAVRYEKNLPMVVEPTKARFSSWYEMFPRSASAVPGRHGTFQDCEARLPYVAALGFDVLYFPPIHPIGETERKGKNNSMVCEPDDVGSPWAIGCREGGHTSIHPNLGTMEDFERLVAKAHDYGLEIALDLAFQCSPDHPYVKEHPEWFRRRPDGTIQYAENPPKKYQDIYPINFETDQWESLWQELQRVVCFWIDRGVRIFRVDNPHTKPFAFWEWLIQDVKREHPDVIFLSEAFTRPKTMYQLAKLGFTQSYTYFTWRNAKQELTDYFTELTTTDVREFFCPNLWPNTPDILHEYLQKGGRPAFMTRLVLAATLGSSYGIYGPAFELCVNAPKEPGSEEYLNSEKYELKVWELNAPWSLKDLIARINRARREHPALHHDWSLHFHRVDNEMLLSYSKTTGDLADVILVVVNLDYTYTQSGWVTLDLPALGVASDRPFEVHDLLANRRYTWNGPTNYVELNPHVLPAHLFLVR